MTTLTTQPQQLNLQPPSQRKRLVRFSTVQVRQYERIIGDNPSCSSGPSISIGWNYDKNRIITESIDDFEYKHSCLRLVDEEMILSRHEREQLLSDLGYSKSKIAEAVRKNIKEKTKRRQTVNNLNAMPMEQMLENVAKKLSRVFKGKKNKGGSNALYNKWKEDSERSNGSCVSSELEVQLQSKLKQPRPLPQEQEQS
jgi:hypothetical protein